jgi:hypothetical protein
MTRRLIWAMVAYAIVAAFAWFTLGGAILRVGSSSVDLRDAILIFLGGFALKTLIAYGRFRAEEKRDAANAESEPPNARD